MLGKRKWWLGLGLLLCLLINPVQYIKAAELSDAAKNQLAQTILAQLEHEVFRFEPEVVRPFFHLQIASLYSLFITKEKNIARYDQIFQTVQQIPENQWQAAVDSGLFDSRETMKAEQRSLVKNLANGYAMYNECDKVAEILALIPASDQVEVFEELVQTFLEYDHLSSAVWIVERFQDQPAKYLRMLLEVASAYAFEGDKKQAKQLIEKVRQNIFLITKERDPILNLVSRCYLEISEYDTAIQVAHSIQDSQLKQESLHVIIEKLNQVGLSQQKREVMKDQFELLIQQKDSLIKIKNLLKLVVQYDIADKSKKLEVLSYAVNGIEHLPIAEQNQMRSRIITCFMGLGELELALNQVAGFSNLQDQVDELIQISKKYQQNQPDQAKLLLNLGLQIAEKIKEPINRADYMAKVIGKYLDYGYSELAVQLARNRKGVYNQSVAMVELVHGYLNKNSYELALSTAFSIPNTYRRSYALNIIGDWLAKNGNQEQAIQLLNQSLAEVKQLRETSFKQDRYYGVAHSFTNMGMYDLALTLVKQIDKQERKAVIIKKIADRMTKLDELDRLLEFAEQLQAIELRMYIIRCKGELLLQEGSIERALALVVKLDAGEVRERLLCKVADAFIEQGAIASAREIGLLLNDPSPVNYGIICFQAYNGDYETAMASLNEIKDFDQKQEVFEGIILSINAKFRFI